MNPKSEKPLRLFNPFSIWTDIALKSGTAMLEAAQAAVTSAKPPKVAILAEADSPSSKPRRAAAKKRRASAAKSAKKSASSRARRRTR
jgi:hypothetical protein